MKRIGIAVAVAAVVVLSGGTVFATTGGEGALPQKGTWEHQWAMETGNLPSSDAGSFRNCYNSATPVEETVQIGAFTYRVGTDTQ